MPIKKTQSTTHKLTFKDLDITHIVNKRLKNSYIQISKNKEIILKTPKLSDIYIDALLSKKELWIKKQLTKIQDKRDVNKEDEVLLFGEIISIDLYEAKKLRECLEKIKTSNGVESCYDKFYKFLAIEHLTKRLDFYSNIMNLEYSEVVLKKMKRRWGSCSSARVITLNTQMIKLPKNHIDYIIVHELSHLVHMNHSKAFYSLVAEFIPNYKEIQKEIKYIA